MGIVQHIYVALARGAALALRLAVPASRVTGKSFAPDMPRRNIVTQAVALNELCGQQFKVDPVLLERQVTSTRSVAARSTFQYCTLPGHPLRARCRAVNTGRTTRSSGPAA